MVVEADMVGTMMVTAEVSVGLSVLFYAVSRYFTHTHGEISVAYGNNGVEGVCANTNPSLCGTHNGLSPHEFALSLFLFTFTGRGGGGGGYNDRGGGYDRGGYDRGVFTK